MNFVKVHARNSRRAPSFSALFYVRQPTDTFKDSWIIRTSLKIRTAHENQTRGNLFRYWDLASPMADHAANPDSDRTHPMTFVKDSVITTKIKAKLADEKMRTLVHIKLDTDNKGAVVLSGKVRIQEKADKAVSIALDRRRNFGQEQHSNQEG